MPDSRPQDAMIEGEGVIAGDVSTLLTLHDLHDATDSQPCGPDVNLSTQARLSKINRLQKGAGLTPFKSKSTFVPLATKDAIDTFHDCVTNEIKQLYRSTKNRGRKKYDRRQAEYSTLMNKLSKNTDIVIKTSDKGGNVVIWP